MPHIVILGGTGRIGRAVAEIFYEKRKDCVLTLVGRNAKRGPEVVRQLGDRAHFFAADFRDRSRLLSVLSGADLVIHAAGPFQDTQPLVLEAAIEAGVSYLDIADDLSFAYKARALSLTAQQKGISAIVNGGVFPGLSNIMAGCLAEDVRQNAKQGEESSPVTHLRFDYFIAGSGGAGPAVMASTFLLGTRPATEYVDGKIVERTAFTGGERIAFLPPIGTRKVYYLELPEVSSSFETYHIPNIASRFGTSPGIWNHLTRLCCLLFRPWLGKRERVASFVRLMLPLVRLLDRVVGAAIGIEVEAVYATGEKKRLRYAHDNTIVSIASAVLAQADEILCGRVRHGVFWPEEAISNKKEHLQSLSGGIFRWE